METVIHGECVGVMRGMEPDSVDAVICDPPYGLEFMGKGWDKLSNNHPNDPRMAMVKSSDAAPRSKDNPWQKEASGYGAPKKNPHCRSCGKQKWGRAEQLCQCESPAWDTRTSEYARDMQLWHLLWANEAFRVLKPGGHLLAFGGTRTYHRMVCAIEDAGFEIRDSIHWMYGSGFPKSHNLGGDWQGWGTALKPGHEPIVVARKPLIGTVAQNVLTHGTGALNIDACRISTEDKLGGGAEMRVAVEGKHEGWKRPWMDDEQAVEDHTARIRQNVQHAEQLGRWPANIILDEHSAAELDAMSGPNMHGAGSARKAIRECEPTGHLWQLSGDGHRYGDSGGASRFFYCAKASRSERGEGNNHPTVKPLSLMRYLCRLVTPNLGVILDPFAGSGTTLLAARQEGFECIGIEREAGYVDIIHKRLAIPEPTGQLSLLDAI